MTLMKSITLYTMSLVLLLAAIAFASCGRSEEKVKSDIDYMGRGAIKTVHVLHGDDNYGDWAIVEATWNGETRHFLYFNCGRSSVMARWD